MQTLADFVELRLAQACSQSAMTSEQLPETGRQRGELGYTGVRRQVGVGLRMQLFWVITQMRTNEGLKPTQKIQLVCKHTVSISRWLTLLQYAD